LLDRFDLRIEVQRPPVDDLLGGEPGESSHVAARRVRTARARAIERGVRCNGAIPGHRLDELAPVTTPARALLRRELELGRLTGRGLHRVRRVARTLADLAGAGDEVDDGFIAMALNLRVDPLERARSEVAA
jgi:magnesium chelatase family protein